MVGSSGGFAAMGRVVVVDGIDCSFGAVAGDGEDGEDEGWW